jgi:hypothetical protein
MKNFFQFNYSLQNELNYMYMSNETSHFPFQTSNSWALNKNLANSWRFNSNQSQSRIVFTGNTAIFFELAQNLDYFEMFLNYGLVSNATLQKASAVLHDRDLQSNNFTVNAVYRVGYELATSILRIFWRPKLSIRSLVENYIEHYFKNNYVIGIQLRYHYLDWNDTFVFFECAQAIEAEIKTKPVKWFVTSDNEGYLSEIKKIKTLLDKIIYSNGSVKHVDQDTSGYGKALTDLELLRRCDEFIITGGSTFGFTASLLNGRYPMFVNGQINAKQCERFSFFNPSRTPRKISNAALF